ncbi:unnamed protein product [Timema podura]|uniref:Uncharacterized protein n=1 Tax=Timema podura TaxID=61482 RepID=A0ABN7NB34_TIMPD|nr:unnamed protein product [Timema podura]
MLQVQVWAREMFQPLASPVIFPLFRLAALEEKRKLSIFCHSHETSIGGLMVSNALDWTASYGELECSLDMWITQNVSKTWSTLKIQMTTTRLDVFSMCRRVRWYTQNVPLPSTEMGNKQAGQGQSEGEEEASSSSSSSAPRAPVAPYLDQNGEEGEEEVELPPPMKPISEPILVTSAGASGGSDESQGKRGLQNVSSTVA